MTAIRSARFITVAAPSASTDQEWVDAGRRRDSLPGPVYSDYALMKVLYMLRFWDHTSPIHAFKHEDPLVPLDFSSLEDSDWIYVAGHGNPDGVYAMGPNPKSNPNQNTDRLLEILTKDGSLQKKRKDKPITVVLLSCRSGLGFHKVMARKLFKKLGSDITVGGAKGFTFGSVRTGYSGYNEVLIRGLPWHMEYQGSIPLKEAEKETSKREGKTITFESKKTEISTFTNKSGDLEKKMQTLIGKLKSTEINNALDEVEKNSRKDWESLIMSQAMHYTNAKKRSNLEFDMWFPDLNDGYVWTEGKDVTDQEVDAFLKGIQEPIDVLTSVK